MNAGREFEDDMLMAYADGELDESERAAIAAAAAADPALAARIASFARSRVAVKEAFAAIHAEPPPARLVAAATGGRARVATFPGRSLAPRARFALPLAAAIAIGAGIVGFLAGRLSEEPGTAGGLAGLDGAFAALAGTRSGEALPLVVDGRPAQATALASFETAQGLCRVAIVSFGEGGALRGMGCAGADGWRTTVVIAEGAAGAFGPASAAGVEIVEATLDALDAGAALGPDEEARAIAGGWR